MKKTIIAALAAVVCGLSAMAQEKNPSDTVALPQDVQMMRVAGELVKYGYDKSQALPLIQAVEIYQAVGEGNFDGEKTNSESATKDSSVSYDINQIIADAAELADGDPNLVALVEIRIKRGKQPKALIYFLSGQPVKFQRADHALHIVFALVSLTLDLRSIPEPK